ncbi:MAG: hypothetical protein SF182_15755 [Deltaproteobacteria bacterium]|nr:hypothetical protein [Deltaproteobacteria bacterium]
MQRGGTAAALIGLLALAGCAGDGGTPVPAEGWFNQLQTQVFNQHCLNAGCHNSTNVAGGLNLSPGASYAALVGVEPDNVVARADGMLRVEAFAPDNSFLLTKVTMPGLGEGGRMPLSMAPLSSDDITLIRTWITEGAPPAVTGVPTATATPTGAPPTATATPLDTATPSETPTAPNTATPTATVTGSAPPTATSTHTPSQTPTASETPTPTATPTLSLYAQIQTQIFDVSCATLFCHDLQGASNNLVLTPDVSYGDLVNVDPTNPAALAAGMKRVVPNDTANSYLLLKLTGPLTIPLGSRMPLAQPTLPPEQIQLVVDWINSGATQ